MKNTLKIKKIALVGFLLISTLLFTLPCSAMFVSESNKVHNPLVTLSLTYIGEGGDYVTVDMTPPVPEEVNNATFSQYVDAQGVIYDNITQFESNYNSYLRYTLKDTDFGDNGGSYQINGGEFFLASNTAFPTITLPQNYGASYEVTIKYRSSKDITQATKTYNKGYENLQGTVELLDAYTKADIFKNDGLIYVEEISYQFVYAPLSSAQVYGLRSNDAYVPHTYTINYGDDITCRVGDTVIINRETNAPGVFTRDGFATVSITSNAYQATIYCESIGSVVIGYIHSGGSNDRALSGSVITILPADMYDDTISGKWKFDDTIVPAFYFTTNYDVNDYVYQNFGVESPDIIVLDSNISGYDTIHVNGIAPLYGLYTNNSQNYDEYIPVYVDYYEGDSSSLTEYDIISPDALAGKVVDFGDIPIQTNSVFTEWLTTNATYISDLASPTLTITDNTLYWSPVDGAETYSIYCNGVRIAGVSAPSTSYDIPYETLYNDDILIDGFNSFYIVASNQNEVSSPSNTVEYNYTAPVVPVEREDYVTITYCFKQYEGNNSTSYEYFSRLKNEAYSDGYNNGSDATGGIDFSSWIANAVSGFINAELFPGFTLGGVLGIIVAFSVVMLFLKFFAGG